MTNTPAKTHDGKFVSGASDKRKPAGCEGKQDCHPAVGFLAGLVGMLALAALWHLFGGDFLQGEGSYVYTQYFLGCLSWLFASAYFALSIVLGWIVRSGWPVALGMMLPLPIACGIEVALGPTSHNLLPFEILLYWLPAFGLALLGGYLGKITAGRWSRKKNT